MSRGPGEACRLVLTALLSLDDGQHAPDEWGGYWKVWRIARRALHFASDEQTRGYAAALALWDSRRNPRKIPQGEPSFGTHINIGRVLRILERRRLVERVVYGPGSLARLTLAGRECAKQEAERLRARDEAAD
jgi:hypothetical protein